MKKRYRSAVMASIHETAEGLHVAGVSDNQTMRKFDDACLTPQLPLSAEAIRALRERAGASQAVQQTDDGLAGSAVVRTLPSGQL